MICDYFKSWSAHKCWYRPLSLFSLKCASRPKKTTRVRTVDFFIHVTFNDYLSNLGLYVSWQVNVIMKLPPQRYSQHPAFFTLAYNVWNLCDFRIVLGSGPNFKRSLQLLRNRLRESFINGVGALMNGCGNHSGLLITRGANVVPFRSVEKNFALRTAAGCWKWGNYPNFLKL